MNILLYTQSRITLSRLLNQTNQVDSPIWDNIEAYTLPESIFEELGYFGALENNDEVESDNSEIGDSYEELFRAWSEPLLIR